jgi:hypothetical protein
MEALFLPAGTRIGDGGAGTLAIELQADQIDAWGSPLPLRERDRCIHSKTSNRWVLFSWTLFKGSQPLQTKTSGHFRIHGLDSGFRSVLFLQQLSIFWQTPGGRRDFFPVFVFGSPVTVLSLRGARS